MNHYRHETHFSAPAKQVFQYLAQPGAFDRLKPPTENITAVDHPGTVVNGSTVHLRLELLGPFVYIPWVLTHQDYIENQQFRDVQVRGPFAYWNHLHQVVATSETTCTLVDDVTYSLPVGLLTNGLGKVLIEGKLSRLFSYREKLMYADLELLKQLDARLEGCASMKILLSGSTGLVGSALMPFLTTQGHQVTRLVRKADPNASNTIQWNPYDPNGLKPEQLEGFDAIVHLSGENIATSPWTASKRKKIMDSRVLSTQLLANTMAKLQNKPKVFVCASATGFYGETGTNTVDETSSKGQGFLADTCQAWENACQSARDAGIRVVNIRTGVVLSPNGGALQKMLPPFLMGGGGILGNGKQIWSWIGLDDLVGIFHHAITNNNLSGPVNAVTPNSVSNHEFTKTLGKVIHRPTIFPVPAIVLKTLLGEMADAILLGSCHVKPNKLIESGYTFRTPQLEDALKHMLG